jgi:glycosyltransferase involved in cell wall biosynthesis
MPANTYVLVTPVRDEASTIGRTLAAVVGQTVLPREWVIVSDGSTDATDDIVRSYANRHPWIRLVALPPRRERSFAAVVVNTELGIRQVEMRSFDYLGLLDGDVVFQADYFEQLMARFDANPRLGLAGGVVIDVGLPKRLPVNRIDIPGAVQFYRRTCFDAIGRLCPIPEGGWDALACAQARMSGFETQLMVDLVVDHLKPRNVSQGGPLRRKWQMGTRDYAAGYHPLFELVKCCGLVVTERPVVGAAIARWGGFCVASLRRQPRVVPARIVAHVRQEQLGRLRRVLSQTAAARPQSAA